MKIAIYLDDDGKTKYREWQTDTDYYVGQLLLKMIYVDYDSLIFKLKEADLNSIPAASSTEVKDRIISCLSSSVGHPIPELLANSITFHALRNVKTYTYREREEFALKCFEEIKLFTKQISELVNQYAFSGSFEHLPLCHPIANTEVTCTYNIIDNTPFEIFSIDTLQSLCVFDLFKSIEYKASFRTCQNCSKLFIPLTRSDEIYCDNIFNTTGKTCKSIGYENKVKSDKFLSAYRTAYKTKNAYKNRNMNNNPHAEEDFSTWKHAAKLKLDDAQKGKISIEEFKEWLKK